MKKIEISIPKLNYSVSEAYKSLRTNLKFCGEDKKVIEVTSCFSEEGKSTVSLNLANSLAESGERVVLVDADLRRSVLPARVGVVDEVQGLSHFLSGQVPLNDILYATDIPNLFILFAGPTPPNPSELLAGKGVHAMIESLKSFADYIIMDTPPLGQVIDSAVIAKECDGFVLVLESGADSRRIVREVKNQMERTGCPILGVVLNKVQLERQHRYGKYHSKKYGKYYGEYYGKNNSF